MTGIDMVHVPYRGGAPAMTDLIAGQVQVMFSNLPASIEYIRAGKLRALAVTTADALGRASGCPDRRRVRAGLRGERVVWASARPRTRLPRSSTSSTRRSNAALADPKIKARLADFGGTVLAGSPADFGKLIAEETEKWAKVIRIGNIKPE